MCLFLIQCGWPVCFYFTYIHCANILSERFGFSAIQIINQNLIVTIMELVQFGIIAFLSTRINPISIVKFGIYLFVPLMLATPYLIIVSRSSFDILILQFAFALFKMSGYTAFPIFIKRFPVLQRYTRVAFSHALSCAVTYLITSVSLVYLTKYVGHWGLLIVMVPVTIGFILGLRHFECLERPNN